MSVTSRSSASFLSTPATSSSRPTKLVGGRCAAGGAGHRPERRKVPETAAYVLDDHGRYRRERPAGTHCRRTARWTCSSRGDGSTPSRSASRSRALGVRREGLGLAARGGQGAHRAARGAVRPAGRPRSARGARRSPLTASPSARSASIRSSTARRQLPSRAAGAAANSSPATSASGGTAPGAQRLPAGSAPLSPGHRRPSARAPARAAASKTVSVDRLRRHREPVARRGGFDDARRAAHGAARRAAGRPATGGR